MFQPQGGPGQRPPALIEKHAYFYVSPSRSFASSVPDDKHSFLRNLSDRIGPRPASLAISFGSVAVRICQYK